MTRGLQATRVKDITEAADVGKGTFFNYFPTKEHVLAAFYQRQRGTFDEALKAVEEGRVSARHVLVELTRRLSQGRTAALTRSFLLAIISSKAVRELVLPELDASYQRNKRLLTIAQERGEIRQDVPASELARALRELSFGSAMFWSFRPKDPLERVLLANLDLLFGSSDATARCAPASKPRRRPAGRRQSASEGRTQSILKPGSTIPAGEGAES